MTELDTSAIDEWADIHQAVFIVGAPRSGTSLLYRSLQQHPSFRPRRLDLEEPKVFDQLRSRPSWRRRPPAPLTRYLLDDTDAWTWFVDDLPGGPAVSALSTFLARGPWKADRRVTRLTCAAAIARRYYFVAATARGADRLVSKSPDEIAYADLLAAAFPRSSLLFIHRDPVAVYGSYRRRFRDDPDADWANLSVEQLCTKYRADAERALSARERLGDRFRLVSYDTLVDRPGPVLEELCRSLGESFDPDMLAAGEFSDPHWNADPKLFDAIDGAGDGASMVDDADTEVITEALADVVDRLRSRDGGVGS